MSFEAWTAVEKLYWVITYFFIVDIYNKIHDQCSEIFKSKTVFTAAIQQTIIEFCKLISVSSILMRELKSLIFFWALDSEFYHLKKQIKVMKLSDINLEKMRSLINEHLIQIIKSPALTVISSSANLANKNKQKSDQEEQFRNQSNQSNWLNKRQ